MKTEVIENNPSISNELKSIIAPLREKYGFSEYINYEDFEKLADGVHDLPTHLQMHRLQKNESAMKLWEFSGENFIYKHDEYMTKEIRVMTLLKFINDFNGDNIISSIVFHSMQMSDMLDMNCLSKLIQGRNAHYAPMVDAVNKMPNVTEDPLFLPQHQRLNEVINSILEAIDAESIPVFDELIELHHDKIVHLNKQMQRHEDYEAKKAKEIKKELS